jgi:hypothetical protein
MVSICRYCHKEYPDDGIVEHIRKCPNKDKKGNPFSMRPVDYERPDSEYHARKKMDTKKTRCSALFVCHICAFTLGEHHGCPHDLCPNNSDGYHHCVYDNESYGTHIDHRCVCGQLWKMYMPIKEQILHPQRTIERGMEEKPKPKEEKWPRPDVPEKVSLSRS